MFYFKVDMFLFCQNEPYFFITFMGWISLSFLTKNWPWHMSIFMILIFPLDYCCKMNSLIYSLSYCLPVQKFFCCMPTQPAAIESVSPGSIYLIYHSAFWIASREAPGYIFGQEFKLILHSLVPSISDSASARLLSDSSSKSFDGRAKACEVWIIVLSIAISILVAKRANFRLIFLPSIVLLINCYY